MGIDISPFLTDFLTKVLTVRQMISSLSRVTHVTSLPSPLFLTSPLFQIQPIKMVGVPARNVNRFFQKGFFPPFFCLLLLILYIFLGKSGGYSPKYSHLRYGKRGWLAVFTCGNVGQRWRSHTSHREKLPLICDLTFRTDDITFLTVRSVRLVRCQISPDFSRFG